MLLRENTKKKKKNPTAVIEVVLLDFFCDLS
jgi:hypothetical protein